MNDTRIFRTTLVAWLLFAAAVLFLGAVSLDGLKDLVRAWESHEEYSHGFLIPVIVLFLVWQKKNELEKIPFEGSWAGLLLLVLGVVLFYVGELSALFIVVQYAFIVSLYGLALAWMGWKGLRVIWVPLLLLAFAIPLPGFLYNNLSAQLQLISSEIGVWVIRLFGISVYLEGNVIDLGTYKLQVVEACSGLRYLFPLMTLGFIMAYIYEAAFWKKMLVFLSTIPITVLMNSFRIGVIGVLVEFWGQAMAEGFLHDFEGWVVFMACLGVLLAEMWLLSFVGRDRKPLAESFAIEFPEPAPDDVERQPRRVPATLYVSIAVTVAALLLSTTLEGRKEIIPEREDFTLFPLRLDGWTGKRDRLESIYIDTLKFDDYIIADYISPDGRPVNLYVAYYASQSKGESAHSPRSCLPGGGWKMVEFDQKQIDATSTGGRKFNVNRVLIKKGDYTQLVYYWFQGRSRIITNEYMVKWYLFWDALHKNRSDGALVRLTEVISPDEDIRDAEKRLTEFAGKVSRVLDEYVPD
ncbi:MAG TPA: VPLPA-CTERM-specific exosortase XrtD [Thiolapillus brandeum]|uniref:VPLPA-CTERM-specific exosortase XrtD n=1 Tax=Thiolapillus brandeum TaxID=1076588 RepID=A0A831RWB2_9GAMM|nr:VPLPA-CTERM-specific exosortase XrtD [Thiolapillus brandeum]